MAKQRLALFTVIMFTDPFNIQIGSYMQSLAFQIDSQKPCKFSLRISVKNYGNRIDQSKIKVCSETRSQDMMILVHFGIRISATQDFLICSHPLEKHLLIQHSPTPGLACQTGLERSLRTKPD